MDLSEFKEKLNHWWAFPCCGCALILALIIITIAALASTYTKSLGDQTPAGGGAGVCSNVPAPYDKIFGTAGDKWKVQPGFLAAIFVAEHGPVIRYRSGYSPVTSKTAEFPEAGGDPEAIIKWETSSAGALGPMQFMPGTWPGYAQDANGDGSTDPQNIVDAAFASAKYLAMAGAGGNTTDLDKLRDAASQYNSGRPWSQGQNIRETSRYVPKVINKFQQFYCDAGGAGYAAITGKTYYPVKPPIISFGNSRHHCTRNRPSPCNPNGTGHSKFHKTGVAIGDAVDLKSGAGNQIYAIFDGGAEKRYTRSGGFSHLRLHSASNSVVFANYAHINATKTGRVNAGDIIGYYGVGAGHLHFELWPNEGKSIEGDPARGSGAAYCKSIWENMAKFLGLSPYP